MVICQKSKVEDWTEHFINTVQGFEVFDLTNKKAFSSFIRGGSREAVRVVGVINYDLLIRRLELLSLRFDTIMLDESSMIKNDTSQRTKTILRLGTKNVILLSGTPTGGKYEELYSQLKLLGWKITKTDYWKEYIKTRKIIVGGFMLPIVTGYKNVGGLKRKMREYGCDFLKTSEVFDLPAQTFQEIKVEAPAEYKTFVKKQLVEIDGALLVGDTVLTKMLYARELCGAYAPEKVKALADLIESTNDRLIIFYNFNIELDKIKQVCKQLPNQSVESL